MKKITLLILFGLFSSIVYAQNVNIPDAAFKAALVGNLAINTNNDSEIQVSEASAYTGTINVSSKNINRLTGIEAFTALTKLNCENNQLLTIDVSANVALTYLNCGINRLRGLDVSANTALTTLFCQSNRLVTLNISANTALTELYCERNRLTSLDVSAKRALTTLYCNNNNLTSLDIANGNNLNMTVMQSHNNSSLTCIQTDAVIVSTNPRGWYKDATASYSANCNNTTYALTANATNGTVTANPLPTSGSYASGTTVTLTATPNAGYVFANWSGDASGTNATTTITMNANKTVTANFTQTCANIVSIPDTDFKNALLAHGTTITGQNIRVIDTDSDGVICANEAAAYTGTISVGNKNIRDLTGIEHFVNITKLDCSVNSLSSLNVSANTALTKLNCSGNSLSSLNVSANTALTELICNNNTLSSLDVSANTALTILSCYTNPLNTLNVSANILLTELYCSDNSLSSLDVSANTALTVLWCTQNSLSSLDVSANTALTRLDCYLNSLSSLDVSANTALTKLYCFNNSLSSLNVSANTALIRLDCSNNSLSGLNIANGNNTSMASMVASGNTNLTCIQTDSNIVGTTPSGWRKDAAASYSNSCNNTPYSLIATASAGGTVTPTNGTFTSGTTVTLTATPNAGYVFANWSGDASGTNATTTVTMNANKTVTANFIQTCANIVSIPDTNFKNALLAHGTTITGQNIRVIDTDGDGVICANEATTYTGTINVFSKNISSLTGIEAFTNITRLRCDANQLTVLDLSSNMALTNLICDNNQLTSLNVSQNTALTNLICDNNQLTSLNVSQNTALTNLICDNNQLTSLDVSQNIALTKFTSTRNQLRSLNVANTNNSAITMLNVNRNPNLTCIQHDTGFTPPPFTFDAVRQTYIGWGKDATASYSTNCNNTTYTLTTNATNGIVTANPLPTNGSYASGTTVTLVATPNAGYIFTGWGGDASGTATSTTITMNGNKTVTANFVPVCNSIVSIPNSNFKNALLAHGRTITGQNINLIDINRDGQIQCTEAAAYTGTINIESKSVSNLTGIEHFVNITALNCRDNQLTSLNLSANTALTVLKCNYNSLSSLDFSTNTALTELYCEYNQLTSLNVSANTALTYLDCRENQFTSLDFSSNTALTALHCEDNRLLTSLNIANGNNANITAMYTINNLNLTCIQVDANIVGTDPHNWQKESVTGYSVDCSAPCTNFVNIPDTNFKNALVAHGVTINGGRITKIDFNGDGKICVSEAQAYTGRINVRGKSIRDLTGIEHFVNIKILQCEYNALTSLDVSANTDLTELNCEYNALTSLDVSANTALTTLNCKNNTLTSLNIANGNNASITTMTAQRNTNLTCIQTDASIVGTNPTGWVKDSGASYSANCSNTVYTLTANATAGGTVTPTNGSFANGSTVTLTATPNAGYVFVNWSGDASGTNGTTGVTMNGNKTVTANFAVKRTLTITANNGSVTTNPVANNGGFANGSTVVLTATPNAGFQFSGWTGNVTAISSNSGSILMNADKSVTANFTRSQYTLNVNSGSNGSVTRNIQPLNGRYSYGTQVVLTALPRTGYRFVGWSGDASGTTNPLSVTINSNKNVTAIFSKIKHTLTINATNGSVTRSLQPTNGTYDYGTLVTLTAVPNTGYKFDGWSDDASGTTVATSITINANKNVTATFSKIQHTLTVSATNGSVTRSVQPTNGTYDYGTQVTLTAVPNVGYKFNGWGGDATGTTTATTITVDADKNVTATFSKIQHTLTVSTTNGSVTRNVQPTNGKYNYGTQVTLTAVPDAGYKFSGWGGDATGTTTATTITINADKNVTATFSKIQHTLTINATNGLVKRSVQPTNGAYDYSTQVTLTAVPDAGYKFDGWSGDVFDTETTITINMKSNKNITAKFSKIEHTLKISATNGSVKRSVQPTNGTYNYGTKVVLTALPDAGYKFNGWGGDATGTDIVTTIIVDADKNVKATFSKIKYTLKVIAANGSVTRSVQPVGGTYDGGTKVVLTAVPDAGYKFDGWSGDVSGEKSATSITIDTDKNVTATFSKIQHTLTVSATNGSVTRSVQPTNGTYSYGTQVTLTALPDAGYKFDGWSGDVTATTTATTITIDADKNVTATFSQIQSVLYTLNTTATNGVVTTNPSATNGEYTNGSTVQLTATPNAGYKFNGWSGDASGLTNPLTVTMDSDKSITAIFTKIIFTDKVSPLKGFSPNGDGINDTWVVKDINNFPNNKVEVFNRWGKKVYQAINYQNDWDGKANQQGGSNENLPAGSYLYIIDVNKSGVKPIKGWIYINY